MTVPVVTNDTQLRAAMAAVLNAGDRDTYQTDREAVIAVFQTLIQLGIIVGPSSTVQASPAPTTTTFSVASGLGASMVVGEPVTVGAQTSTISGIATDAITVNPAFGTAPTAGQGVIQNLALTEVLTDIYQMKRSVQESG